MRTFASVADDAEGPVKRQCISNRPYARHQVWGCKAIPKETIDGAVVCGSLFRVSTNVLRSMWQPSSSMSSRSKVWRDASQTVSLCVKRVTRSSN